MRVEYDRTACAGWFQCVQEWGAFEMDMQAGKADLKDSEQGDDDVFRREVPAELEAEAKAAAETCPVDAIKIYDDGELIVPSE